MYISILKLNVEICISLGTNCTALRCHSDPVIKANASCSGVSSV